jgi:predicted  nucleic acid-binding Zn-ribbon protein
MPKFQTPAAAPELEVYVCVNCDLVVADAEHVPAVLHDCPRCGWRKFEMRAVTNPSVTEDEVDVQLLREALEDPAPRITLAQLRAKYGLIKDDAPIDIEACHQS